ncbi:MAG TPA: sialidase family protein, partial [Candidatus Kapabacteria bacterium]|nr:sialidase family protein [Candidatus Kapabacteria bacterium]
MIGSGIRPGIYIGQINQYAYGIRETQGASVAIYKTTDGGNTWTESAVPAHFPGAVTQICMVDSLVGYASIFSDIEFDFTGTFGASCLWETTDGGATWFDTLHLDHIASSVYAQQGLLMFTKWDYYYQLSDVFPSPPLDTFGGACSYDGGTTWTENFRRANGIAFSDSLNGVVTEMNSQTGGANFWVTMDAGRTWQPSSNNQYEAWSVYAVAGKRMYFCANESQGGYPADLPYKSINWSTDGGLTWSERTSFPVMHFTGTIAGAGNTLYFQTDDADYDDIYQTGMYRSDDLGANWHWVGGPSNSRDTRFAVTGCQGQVVYAFDELGDVWKTVDGGDGTLGATIGLDADTIFWLPNPCGDTLNFNAFCSNCIPISIDSANILNGTELIPLLEPGKLPAPLKQSDSAKISLLYSPTISGESYSVVRVFAHSGEDVLTRDVTVRIENSISNTLAISPDSSNMIVGSCGSAMDSVLIFNSGCMGLVIDSVIIPSSEVAILDSLPALVSDTLPYQLRFLYQPDSAEDQTVLAHIYAHQGRHFYDTVITLQTQSTQAPPRFVLDSTTLTFETRYCQPQSAMLGLSAISCDSVTIDSAISTNSGFVLSGMPSTLVGRSQDSLAISYAPDSTGITSGTIQIFAHDGAQQFDTTIFLTGANFAIPQAVTLSTTGLTLATSACQPILDTFFLSDQGCDSLYLDSVITGDSSEISIHFDSTLLPMRSNDTLPFRIVYSPQDGTSKASVMQFFLHTSSRRIDTTIALNISNTIPDEPLALSSDSLYLFTKYCQPVSMPLQISNFGCQPMTIDSTVILGDTLGEFSFPSSKLGIATNQTTMTDVTFTPNIAESRSVKIKVYLHEGLKAKDTVISLAAKNLTAPVPDIPPLPSLAAGTFLRIPIMLEPTNDTFSIHSYAFHLSFNTDLLTPQDLEFSNTCSNDTLSYIFTPEPGSGCSARVFLRDTISDTAQLWQPLVYVRAKVSLTLDTVTSVTLDSFVTDREPALELCSIPEQRFHLAIECGDPLFLQLLNAETLSFNFISVAPNPAASGNWNIDYSVGNSYLLKLEVYDAE